MDKLDKYTALFLEYTRQFSDVPNAAPLRQKIEHTKRVFYHAQRIIESLDKNNNERKDFSDWNVISRAALLAALFHDCGRFPQYKIYKTFRDSLSVNHAELSVQIIKEKKFLVNEPEEVRQLTETAVALHNRHSLPANISYAERMCTDIVRDSDKFDIIKIMIEYLEDSLPEQDAIILSLSDNSEKWTPGIAEQVLSGNVGKYSDLTYINDFRMLLGSWMYELRFFITKRALAESRLMEKVISGIPNNKELIPVKIRLMNELEQCASAGSVLE